MDVPCANYVIHTDGRNSMAVTHPDLAEEHIGDSTRFVAGTMKVLTWKCSTCSHTWEATGANRARGSGCPSCNPGGFDKKRPGHYYVLRINDTDSKRMLWKGGISNNYEHRIRQHLKHFSNHDIGKEFSLQLEEIYYFHEGLELINFERKLLDSNIRAPNIEGLSHELFTSNPLEYARTLGWIT